MSPVVDAWRGQVKALAKKHKYNFDAVAAEIGGGVTEEEVRLELTARTFGRKKKTPAAEETPIVQQSPARKQDPSIKIQVKENASWDELFAAQEAVAREHRKKREAVFDRVLTAIGGNTDKAPIGSSPAETTWARQREVEAEEEARAAARQADIDEWRTLASQRDALRRRFDVDSADAIGEDPLREHEAQDNEIQSDLKQIGLDTNGLDELLDDLEREHESAPSQKCSAELEHLFQLMDNVHTGQLLNIDQSTLNQCLQKEDSTTNQITQTVISAPVPPPPPPPPSKAIPKETPSTLPASVKKHEPPRGTPGGRCAIYSQSTNNDDETDDDDDIDWNAWRRSHKEKAAVVIAAQS